MSGGGAKATRPGDQGGCAGSTSSSWRAHKSEADVKNMAARHASSHGTGDEVGVEVTVEAVLAAVVLFISWQALHNADLIDIGFQKKKRSRDQASSRRTLCTAKESNEECEECSAELGAGSWEQRFGVEAGMGSAGTGCSCLLPLLPPATRPQQTLHVTDQPASLPACHSPWVPTSARRQRRRHAGLRWAIDPGYARQASTHATRSSLCARRRDEGRPTAHAPRTAHCPLPTAHCPWRLEPWTADSQRELDTHAPRRPCWMAPRPIWNGRARLR